MFTTIVDLMAILYLFIILFILVRKRKEKKKGEAIINGYLDDPDIPKNVKLQLKNSLGSDYAGKIHDELYVDPLQQTTYRAHETIQQAKDGIIREAINHVLGTDKWELDEVKGRCQMVSIERLEKFTMDGKELIIFYPPTQELPSELYGVYTATLSFEYIILY